MPVPKKSLFTPKVPPEKMHPGFKLLLNEPSNSPARAMLEEVYQDFNDPDGNFLEQFQTTGFDSRLFELYLFAYFSRSGFEVDRTHQSPDFMLTREGITISVEATTVNPTQGISSTGLSLPSGLDTWQYRRVLEHELPIKFGSPLFSKLQQKYWELEHCKGKPFVVAIEAFFDDESLEFSDAGLAQYLYGQRVSASWSQEGTLEVQTDFVESHVSGEKVIPSNFFGQPDREQVSAVMFTNSGTRAKFTRMGYQHGIGADNYDVSRFGYCYNPNPDAKDPTYFSYSLAEPPLVESWGQGLVIFHNPNALNPLPRNFFAEAVQMYVEEGEVKADHPGWHPFSSKTITKHFAKLEHRPHRFPRVFVAAIAKTDFQNICGIAIDEDNPIFSQDGWFMDETESLLGVVVCDKADQDWGYVILARDEHFQFRAISTASSKPSRDIARHDLQLAMAKLLANSQRIFPQ